MAGETDPVRIVVEIIDEFSDELAQLKGQLEDIDMEDLDVDLDIDDNGDIESIKARLEALEENLDTILDIDERGFETTMAKKQALRGDINSTVNFDSNRSGIPSGEELMGIRDATDTSLRSSTFSAMDSEDFGRLSDGADWDFGIRGMGRDMFDDSATMDFQRSMQGVNAGLPGRKTMRSMPGGELLDSPKGRRNFGAIFGSAAGSAGRAFPNEFLIPDMELGDGGVPLSRGDMDIPLSRKVMNLNDEFDNLGRTLLQYRPSIMDWWNVMALLIPLMITMIGLVIGLAAAFVALGAAAATVVGIGLLGWGDSMTESFQNVQQEAMNVAETLFDVLQPAAQAFQPLVEQGMQSLGPMVANLVGPMTRLTEFADEFGEIGGGFFDWIREGIQAAVAMDEIIGQVLVRFGSALGSGLIEMLETMVQEVYKNQEAYMDIAEIFMSLVVTIFNLVKAFSFAAAQFQFFFELLALISDLISNEWMVALITFIGAVIALETALASTLNVLALLMTASLRGWVAAQLPMLKMLVTQLYAVISGAYGARAAILGLMAASGVGLLAAAGLGALSEGVSSMSGPRRGATGTRQLQRGGTTINIQGDVGKREMDRLLDRVPGETRGERDMWQGMEG